MAIVLNPEKLLGFRIVGKVPGGKVGGKLGIKPPFGLSAKIGGKPGVKV